MEGFIFIVIIVNDFMVAHPEASSSLGSWTTAENTSPDSSETVSRNAQESCHYILIIGK